MAREFGALRRLATGRRSHRRLLRRRRQRQVRIPDGVHHHNAGVECDRVRRFDAGGGAEECAGRDTVGGGLPSEDGVSSRPDFCSGSAGKVVSLVVI